MTPTDKSPRSMFEVTLDDYAKLQQELDAARAKIELLSVLDTFCGNCRESKKQLTDALAKAEDYEKALERFSCLTDAVHPTGAYDDSVIIFCEVTAGDIYTMEKALKKWKAK